MAQGVVSEPGLGGEPTQITIPTGTDPFGPPTPSIPTIDTGGAAGTSANTGSVDRFIKILTAVLSAYGAYRQANTVNDAARARQAAIDAARRIATPQEFARIMNVLLPTFRAGAAAGPGAQAAQAINASIGRRGLVGTGIGEAMASSARALPEATAFQSAIAAASGQQQLAAQTALQGSALTPTMVDPVSTALVKALEGFFVADRARKSTGTSTGGGNTDLFPTLNLTP